MAAADDVLDTIEPPAGKRTPVSFTGDEILDTPALAPPTTTPKLPVPAKPADTSTLSQADTDKRYREIWATQGKAAADAFYNQGNAGVPTVTSVPGGTNGIVPAGAPATPEGVTPDLVNRIIGVEGTARNVMSTAEGTGQFIDGTWMNIVRGEPEVAGKTPQEILQMKVSDPAFARRMTGKYASTNMEYLRSLGLPTDDGAIYLAHFLGPAGAAAVLKAPPDTPLASVIDPRAIAANPRLAGMTAGSMKQFAASTVADGGGAAGAAAAGDPYRRIQQQGLDRLSGQIDKLAEAASREAPGSNERRALMQRMMEHSETLMKRYEKLSEAPPKPLSPFEAAGEMTPLLIGLVTLAGAFTRQPALGAINAMGSALGALKQGNDENYKNAVDLWSKQTDHAAKAFGMQNEEIDIILRDRALTEKERQDKLQNAFRVLGLQQDLELAKAGMWEKIDKRQDDRKRLEADLEEKRALTAEHFARARQLAQGGTQPAQIEYAKAKAAFVAENQREPSEVEDKKLYEDAYSKLHPHTAEEPGSVADVVNLALDAKAKELGVSKDQISPDVRKSVTIGALQERSRALSSGRSSLKPEQVVTDLEELVKTADELTAAVEQHPGWVGFQGRGRHLWESTLGQIPGTSLPEAAELEAFRDKMRIFQANLVRPLLGAHYFTGIGAAHIEEIAKGLERFSSPTTTKESLKAIRNRLEQQAQGIKTGAVKPDTGASELTGGLVRPVPPEMANDPDGTTVDDSAGHVWKKQGNQMVPMVAQ